MKDKELPIVGFEPKGNQFGLRDAFAEADAVHKMKNQIQTAIELRDRAVQVALNFVGHHISSSDGSYELLINCIHEAILETDKEGRADEREACARMADELSGERSLGEDIGDAIRARSEK